MCIRDRDGARESGPDGRFDADFARRKRATARFYAEHILSRIPALESAIVHGADSVCALSAEDF